MPELDIHVRWSPTPVKIAQARFDEKNHHIINGFLRLAIKPRLSRKRLLAMGYRILGLTEQEHPDSQENEIFTLQKAKQAAIGLDP